MHDLTQPSQPALSFPLQPSNHNHHLIPEQSVANYCIRSDLRNSNVQKQTTKSQSCSVLEFHGPASMTTGKLPLSVLNEQSADIACIDPEVILRALVVCDGKIVDIFRLHASRD